MLDFWRRKRTGRARDFGALMGQGDPSAQRAEGAFPSVLALHGFGGTPLEVELVVDVARELGLAAYAPLLPGHGTHARDLARSRWVDWVRAAEIAFDESVQVSGSSCIVAGLSMGAMLAAHLASTRPERVSGLIMLANAAWLASPFPAWALRAIAALRLPDFALPKLAADIADLEARGNHLTYSAQPIHAAIDVLRAGTIIQKQLEQVRCPTLILHGARDRVCPVQNAERVARLLGTADKRVVIFPGSRHILTRDVERAEVRGELRRFVARFQTVH